MARSDNDKNNLRQILPYGLDMMQEFLESAALHPLAFQPFSTSQFPITPRTSLIKESCMTRYIRQISLPGRRIRPFDLDGTLAKSLCEWSLRPCQSTHRQPRVE